MEVIAVGSMGAARSPQDRANFMASFMANFMTQFMPWTGHDLGQVHDLENSMTLARDLILDKAMSLARDIAFAICLAEVMVLPTRLAMAMTCPWP